ncbi:MAG: SRPBCC domain-containing protein [Pseudomonadota bacterium]
MKIEKTYDLPFPPKRVFDAWICPDTLIAPTTRIDINPTVGGHCRHFQEQEDRCNRSEGLFFAVEQDRRVRYTWERDRDGEITEIDVLFADGEDGTTLHISHTGFRHEESLADHDSGWDTYVEHLGAFLESSEDPGTQDDGDGDEVVIDLV